MDAALLDTDTLNEVLMLVTGNTVHFAWVPGLKIINWREP